MRNIRSHTFRSRIPETPSTSDVGYWVLSRRKLYRGYRAAVPGLSALVQYIPDAQGLRGRCGKPGNGLGGRNSITRVGSARVPSDVSRRRRRFFKLADNALLNAPGIRPRANPAAAICEESRVGHLTAAAAADAFFNNSPALAYIPEILCWPLFENLPTNKAEKGSILQNVKEMFKISHGTTKEI
ncbi:hypothetical protein QTP88_017307 [Uroleucon formosanum]